MISVSVDLVSINGEIFDPANAKISVFDRGFLFGDAVYEVTRSYGNILFQLEAHLDRLIKSAEAIDLNIGKTRDQLMQELYRLHNASKKTDRYVRIQVTRGEGAIGMAMDLAPLANIVIYVKDVDLVSKDKYENGVSVVTSQRLRNNKRALDPNIKSGNYLNNVLAFKDASKEKAFESIMMDEAGLCAEGTTSNIFRVKNSILQTPPITSDILVGITRKLVIDAAKEIGIQVSEKSFTPQELETSDEVFITSSTREVLPVSKVNKSQLKVGQITKKLAERYKTKIVEYCDWAKSKHPYNR